MTIRKVAKMRNNGPGKFPFITRICKSGGKCS